MGFPEDFFWGCGASSVAVEGASRRADWYRWEDQRGLERSGDGNGFATTFVEDFALFADSGLGHVRITVDWARVEPVGGQIDAGELERLVEMFTAANDAGLHAWATLHHTSLPGWFADDTDGFIGSRPSIHWSRHVDRIAELLDGLVLGWIPVEDPIGWAMRGHLLGTRPPGFRSVEKTHDAVEGALEATFEAARLLSSGSAQVVSSFGLPTLHSLSSEAEADVHRRKWDDTIWRSWTSAISEGVLRWPWRAPAERPDLADTFDAIGMSLPSPIGIGADGGFGVWPRDARADATGFAPNIEQVGEVLHRVADLVPDREIVITGLGVGTEDDPWRDDLHMGWFDQLNAAIADGIPVRGLFFDQAIDGYDFDSGFRDPRGIFSREREPKASLRWVS